MKTQPEEMYARLLVIQRYMDKMKFVALVAAVNHNISRRAA